MVPEGSPLAAVAVKVHLEANGLGGTVRYYGCPGEEGGSGKTFMARGGAFDDLDAAFSWHAAPLTHRSLEEILLQTLRGNLPLTRDDLPPAQHDLVAALAPLGDEALRAVARESLPVRDWRRHRHLLRKAGAGTLTPAEQGELAALREATDRFVTRRSVALALLKWRGHTITTAS